MNEADEEHHVAKVLMAELKSMRTVDGKYIAKFTVLGENVKHHIGEEEAEIFTKAAEEGSDYLQDLGAKMEARKLELIATYGKPSKRPSTKKATARKRVGATTSRMKKGAGTARARTTTAARKTSPAAKKTKAAAKKTKTAASRTGSAAKKTARKASAAAKSSTRAAKSTVRKATKSAKKATRR